MVPGKLYFSSNIPIFLLSEQIYSLTNQVREGIKNLAEVEKAKKLIEQEKNEAQMTLEETEVDHQGGRRS